MTRIYFVCSAIASGAIRAKTNPNRLTYLYHFLLFFCLDTKETKNQALFSFPENSKNEFSYRDPSRSSFLVVYDGRSLHPALKFIPRVFAENEKGRSDEFDKINESFSEQMKMDVFDYDGHLLRPVQNPFKGLTENEKRPERRVGKDLCFIL